MAQKQIYIGLTGEAGSGKDTIANIIEKKFEAKILTFSYILNKALKVFLDKIARADYIWFVKKLTQRYGEDIVSKAMIRNMKFFDNRIIVFNGVRLPSDYEFLKKAGGVFIYITAGSKLRWKRVMKRGQKSDDDAPYERFLKMQQQQTEINIPSIGEKADYTINNDGTLEELEDKVVELAKKIIRESQ